jgi:L-alanine-DL-glutamate epimerase-like enolase superfamily enzyme
MATYSAKPAARPPTAPSIELLSVDTHSIDIPLTRPFRFGIVELRQLRHFVLAAQFSITLPGQKPATHTGIAAENLIPKWFEKNPATTLAQDITSLQNIITKVLALALAFGPQPTCFDFYHTLTTAAASALPTTSPPFTAPLSRQLAVSLLERAALDAYCHAAHTPFHKLLAHKANPLGINPSLLGLPAMPALPAPLSAPRSHLHVRHTVGLADDTHDLPPILATTGITRLKIKLSGHPEQDEARLAHLTEALANTPIQHVTLDGNEAYTSHATWRAFLVRLRRPGSLDFIRARLAWIEQPLHRDIALTPPTKDLLDTFADLPHIIDESDAELADLPTALSLGYVGTSHKNCKGIFKSVRAAALLTARAAAGQFSILSGEDLTIVAPWAMAQDLAVAATVGVIDIERNGQHFAPGLSAFPPAAAQAAISSHPDLYAPHPNHRAHLQITAGQLHLTSTLTKGLGWAGPNPLTLLSPS